MPKSNWNLPSASNFATRVPLYPSDTSKLPSGSHAMNVGRLKWAASAPGTFGVPIVCTSCLPSLVNL